MLRVPYLYDSDSVSLENSISFHEDSLTRQEFLAESDINNIISSFGCGGR